MFTVELYAKIRHAVMVDGLSRREAAKRFGVHRNTITKMLQFSVPPAIGDVSGQLRRSLVRLWRGSTRSLKTTRACTKSSATQRNGFSNGQLLRRKRRRGLEEVRARHFESSPPSPAASVPQGASSVRRIRRMMLSIRSWLAGWSTLIVAGPSADPSLRRI